MSNTEMTKKTEVPKLITKNRRVQDEKLFYFLNDSILFIIFLLVFYPLVYIVSASFSSPNAVSAGRVWLFPVDFSLAGYDAVFGHRGIFTGYVNSIIYTVLGTIFNIFLTVLAAYPLSRKKFKAKNIYMFIFVFTMFFNGGLIPTYMLVAKLGLINTRAIMVLMGGISVYNMIITRSFFQSAIPDSLIEAAELDGLSDIGILLHIFLPLSKAVLAVITLFYAVFHWNQFFDAFIYLGDKKLFPLQLYLREILIMNQIDQSMLETMDMEEMMAREGLADLLKYSLIIVASVPVMLIYPFIQKHFVQGVMIGSIKG
ncbi:MAG: carbohydrate ABC transporter permease [Spirochaetaceae bacterium]